MIGFGKKATGRGSKALASTALALSLLVVTQASPAAASVYRTTGGSASTVVYINTTYHTFGSRTWISQDNGGAQAMAVRLLLYRPNGTWWIGQWQSDRTYPGSGNATTLVFDIGPATIPAGRYYIRMEYAWLMTTGWQYAYDDGGTDPLLGWRWI